VLNFGGNGVAAFSVSQNGVLVYRAAAAPQRQLGWFDRTGKPIGKPIEPASYDRFDLSQDGKQIALSRLAPANQTGIWVLDWERGVTSRVTYGSDSNVVWSPDGRQLAFSSNRRGNDDIFVRNVDATAADERSLVGSLELDNVQDWSKDGQYILYKTGEDLNVLPLFGGRTPRTLDNSSFKKDGAQFSHDGKWIAYSSNDSGAFQIYVVSFPTSGQKKQISTNGSIQPRWRSDGKELYYLTPAGKLMSVELRSGPLLQAGIPKEMFDTGFQLVPNPTQNPTRQIYAVSPDGHRFLILKGVVEGPPGPISVVINWPAMLK